MNRILPIAIVALVLVAGGAWFYTQSASNTAELPNSGAANAATSEDTADSGADSGVAEMVLGAADAPITIIEYASFTCPHCATFHANVYKDLKSNYIDTGKVRFIFREVYFDKFGLWASLVARCGGQERFFGMTDLLFKSQGDWARAGDPVAISEALRKVGRLAGLNSDQLQSCLTDEANAEALVGWYQDNVAKDNISSTPSFIINGEKYSNMGYGDLSEILDGLLEG